MSNSTIGRPLNFGQLLEFLKTDKHLSGLEPVEFRFVHESMIHRNGTVPGSIHSWRGHYEQAAIDSVAGSTVTVRDFVKKIERALDVMHSGWKGGEYWFDLDTSIWYAEPGTVYDSYRMKIEGRDVFDGLYLGVSKVELEGSTVILTIDLCKD